MNKFTQMTYEDIAQADFLKLLPNATTKADFKKPSMYGCRSIRDYYINYYKTSNPNAVIKGMAIGDGFLRIFYKNKNSLSDVTASIYYDY